MTAALERWGRLDTLVNNAETTAVIPHHDVAAAFVDVWRRIFEVNVFGAWAMTVGALPALREAHGSVVNVASVAGVGPVGSSIPYAAGKAALNHMTVLLARVVGRRCASTRSFPDRWIRLGRLIGTRCATW